MALTRARPADDAFPAVPLTRAVLAVFLVLSPVVFWYPMPEPFEACKAGWAQLAALALAAVGLTVGIRHGWRWLGRQAAECFAGPVGLGQLAVLLAAVLATAFSISPRLSLTGAADSYEGLGTVVALTALFVAARRVGGMETVLKACLVGLGIACAYGLIQAFGADPVVWGTYSAVGGWQRPVGTLGHANHLAGYAVLALPLLVWAVARAYHDGRRRVALLGGGLGVMVVAVIALSLSRAAWLAAAVVLGLLVVGHWRRWRFAVLLAGCGGVVGLVLLGLVPGLAEAVRERVGRIAASPGRPLLWQGAWEVFLQHPWTGSGLDTFGLSFPGVRTPAYWEHEWGFLPTRAHNDFLQALATRGIGGGVAYVGLACGLAVAWRRAWRRHPARRGFVLALGCMVVAFYLQNLVGFATAGTAGLVAVVAGVLARLSDSEEATEAEVPLGRVVGAAGVGGVALVLASLAQGCDAATWRLGVTGGALAAGGGLAFALWRRTTESATQPIRQRFAWRPLALPAVVAVLLGWRAVVGPLAGEAVSFRAEALERVELGVALRTHTLATSLAPWGEGVHLRAAQASLHAAGRQSDAKVRDRLSHAADALSSRLCRRYPRSPAAQAGRARILVELARGGFAHPADVLAAFDRALELDPCDVLVLTDAARAANMFGRLDAAEAYIARGLAVSPGLGMLHAERGAVALARGDAGGAEAILRDALAKEWHTEADRRDRTMLLHGLALLQRGEAAQAMYTAEEVLTRHVDWTPAWWLNGLARERLGQPARALEIYRHVLRCQPDNPQAVAGVARLAGTK